MGVYDTVMVPCPTCGTPSAFQTKSGKCLLETFSLDDAPDDVLLDVNRHAPNRCATCDTSFGVAIIGQRTRRTLLACSVVWTKERE